MTQQPPGTGAPQEQDAVTVFASTRLVPVWEETFARRLAAPDDSPEAELWDEALTRLVTALDDAERLAARRCPPLGRRSWGERSPQSPDVPRQRT